MTDDETPSISPHEVKDKNKYDLLDIPGVQAVSVDDADGVIVVSHNGDERDIPDEIDGVPIRAERVGDISPELPGTRHEEIDHETGLGERTKRVSPIPGGVSVSHIHVSGGTSSFILQDGRSEYLASNNHVLADVDEGNHGDFVFQPGKVHDGEHVGYLEDYVPLEDGAVVDLAWAKISQNDTTTDIVGIGGPYGDVYEPKTGDTLVKSGITTGVAHGTVKSTNATVKVNYGSDDGYRIVDEMVITTDMSDPGDSGSPVLHEGRPAGMLFAGSDTISVCMTASNIEAESGMRIKTKPTPTVAMEDAMWTFRARPDPDSRYAQGVLDGDTYDLLIDQAFRMQTTQRVRSRRLDTAEIWNNSGPEELELAREQRDFVREWVRDAVESYSGAWPLLIRTYQEEGKYGRWLADLYNRDEESLAAAVVDEFGSDYLYDDMSLDELQAWLDDLSRPL